MNCLNSSGNMGKPILERRIKLQEEKKKRKGYSTKEAQAAADKRWAENNREHRNYLSYRGTARSFIRNKAKKEDLLELQCLIEKKLKKVHKNH